MNQATPAPPTIAVQEGRRHREETTPARQPQRKPTVRNEKIHSEAGTDTEEEASNISITIALKTKTADERILTRMKQHLLESIYRRILAESYDYSGIAAYVASKANSVAITLYDADMTDELQEVAVLLKSRDVEGAAVALHERGVANGYIKIAASKRPCNDAWEVKFSAGPGYGKFLYGAAFEASPSGFIMPDRGQVSASAMDGWTRAARRSREMLPLDDYKDPRTPPKSDDCKVYGDEVLDAAYSAEGWEFGFMRSARKEHAATLQMMEAAGVAARRWESAINIAGVLVFKANYDPGAVAAFNED